MTFWTKFIKQKSNNKNFNVQNLSLHEDGTASCKKGNFVDLVETHN